MSDTQQPQTLFREYIFSDNVIFDLQNKRTLFNESDVERIITMVSQIGFKGCIFFFFFCTVAQLPRIYLSIKIRCSGKWMVKEM